MNKTKYKLKNCFTQQLILQHSTDKKSNLMNLKINDSTFYFLWHIFLFIY